MSLSDESRGNLAGTIFAIDDIFREICKTLNASSLLRLKRTCRHFFGVFASNSVLWPVLASDRGVIVEKSEIGTYGINTRLYEQFTDIQWDKALFYKEKKEATRSFFGEYTEGCWHKYLVSQAHCRVMESKASQCLECKQTSSLWRCLSPGCGFIGCSRYVNEHALKHSRSNKGHYLASCSMIWCYGCEKYVRDVYDS